MKTALLFALAFVPVFAKYFPREENERITSGTKAVDKEFPYMAFLAVNHRFAIVFTKIVGCSGTIISKYWIMTAAHCVQGYATKGGEEY